MDWLGGRGEVQGPKGEFDCRNAFPWCWIGKLNPARKNQIFKRSWNFLIIGTKSFACTTFKINNYCMQCQCVYILHLCNVVPRNPGVSKGR